MVCVKNPAVMGSLLSKNRHTMIKLLTHGNNTPTPLIPLFPCMFWPSRKLPASLSCSIDHVLTSECITAATIPTLVWCFFEVREKPAVTFHQMRTQVVAPCGSSSCRGSRDSLGYRLPVTFQVMYQPKLPQLSLLWYVECHLYGKKNL